MTGDDRPTPALYDWAAKVYTAMDKRTTIELIDGEAQKVYEGHLTNLFRDLEVPNPYYTTITRALKAMECIIQLRRGGGTALSKWVLLREPTQEDFQERSERSTPRRGKVAVLEQQLRDLKRLCLSLEERVERLEAA